MTDFIREGLGYADANLLVDPHAGTRTRLINKLSMGTNTACGTLMSEMSFVGNPAASTSGAVADGILA
jgi:hypothetical protein